MTLDNVPFAKLLGIELETVEPGHAVLTMPIRNELKQNHGVAHGGSIAAVIDLTIHDLRPLTEGTARASARVVRAGKRVITVSADLVDHQGKLAATAISTYLRLV
jgi:acyl-coenzyme A thioesterase PaaI-like protein